MLRWVQPLLYCWLITCYAGPIIFPQAQSQSKSLLESDRQNLEAFLEATLPPSHAYNNLSIAVCSWKGVRCAGINGEGERVTALFLESLGLSGAIPSNTLSKLTALTELSLYNNSLRGSVPEGLWSLSRLEYLSLSMNLFSEHGSPALGNLASLQRLDLSSNRFEGALPSELGQLASLRYFYMSSNGFTGSLLPDVFGPSLLSVELSSNNLSGSIPSQLGALPNLVSLNLSGNMLTGELPSGFANLMTVDLSRNSLSGSLAPFNGSAKLEQINLSHNNFTGPLPHLKNGQVVKLSNNHLTGPLESLSSPELIILDLSNNLLTGDISALLGTNHTPSNLQYLDLSYNSLSGDLESIARSLSSMSRLGYLNLSSVQLEGALPESLGDMRNLTVLDLSKNNLSGVVPLSLVKMTSLTYLDLSRNSLSGNVSHLSSLPALRHLNVSFNKGVACDPVLLSRFGPASFAGAVGCSEPLPVVVISSTEGSSHKRGSNRSLAFVVGVPVACAAATALLLALVLGFLLAGVQRRRRRGQWPRLRKRSLTYSTKEDSRYNMSGPFSFESHSGPWAANIKNPTSVPVVMFEKPLLNLTFADLLRATCNFDKEAQVSQGGLGPVYSAVLPGGLHVSIKVLIEGRVLTNEAAATEFGVLSTIKHPNLVPLLGYCIVGEERLVIYELMKNGGLHRWLHGRGNSSRLIIAQQQQQAQDVSTDLAAGDRSAGSAMDTLPEDANLSWAERQRVALGVARALAFLHHGQSTQIVHRDVKASNVMLDERLEPHLANTGLAALLAGSTDATFARGATGYAPPEYGRPGGLVTPMGDVYSFGVLLLELVTGKKPVGDSYGDDVDVGSGCHVAGGRLAADLVGYVRHLMHEKRDVSGALDPRSCVDGCSHDQMLQVLRIGYLCTAESPSKRPTIQQVVGLLKDLQQQQQH